MNNQDMRIFVTGGTGFIGSHVVDRLRASGYKVSLLVRSKSDFSYLACENIDIYKGDLGDYKSLKQGMQNCKAVFHIAGLTLDWAKKDDFYQTNVLGTKNVLEAAKEAGIKRMIFVSTTGVLGEEDSLKEKGK